MKKNGGSRFAACHSAQVSARPPFISLRFKDERDFDWGPFNFSPQTAYAIAKTILRFVGKRPGVISTFEELAEAKRQSRSIILSNGNRTSAAFAMNMPAHVVVTEIEKGISLYEPKGRLTDMSKKNKEPK